MTNTTSIDSITISLNDLNDMTQKEFDFSDLNSTGIDTISISSIDSNLIYGSNPSGYSIYTTNNTGSWSVGNSGAGGYNIGNSSLGSASLKVQGDANFQGDVKIKGKSIVDALEKIEEKLAILHPNEELEIKWEQLRELRKQYIALEKEIKDKEKVWEILKK